MHNAKHPQLTNDKFYDFLWGWNAHDVSDICNCSDNGKPCYE